MTDLLTILIVLAVISLAWGLFKKMMHLAVLAGIVLVICAVMNGAITLA